MARAHRIAYRLLHRHIGGARVGIANSVIAYAPDQRLADWWYNHLFFALTRGTHDYLGLNYYFSSRWEAWGGPRSDMGWPINPQGLTQVVLAAKRYRLPIYITENGIADAADRQRATFIQDHLRAIERAQARGADVRGYFYWSLLDNFEWADGFTPRFGLVAVDYKTMRRTIRPSAWAYKAIIDQSRNGSRSS
jgi:beta-glucosidase